VVVVGVGVAAVEGVAMVAVLAVLAVVAVVTVTLAMPYVQRSTGMAPPSVSKIQLAESPSSPVHTLPLAHVHILSPCVMMLECGERS
jgi:hypothetical protein